MGLISKIRGKLSAWRRTFNSASDDTITMSRIIDLFSSSYSSEMGSDLSEIVFFTCMKILSESVGKIPCYLMDADKRRIQDHNTMWYLSVNPNEYQTPVQFFSQLEFARNYYGNAYVYVDRNNTGKIVGLYPLDPRRVQIWINNTERIMTRRYFYFYTDEKTGKSYYFLPEQVMHFKTWLTDESGMSGKSVREILATSFAGAKASTKFLNELYQNGLLARAVVKYVGDLKRTSQNQMLDAIIEQANDKGRRIIAIPVGFDVQKLDLSLADSQFFELKKFTARQISAAFGVNTFYLNDLEKSSYANAAAQNLQFYTATLLYILNIYEQELNRKLLKRSELEAGMGYKFNISVLLRGDPQQQADVIQKLIGCGIYSVNECRRLLDRESCEEGDVRIINGSYMRLEDVGAAYEKGSSPNDELSTNEEEEQPKGGDTNVDSEE